MGAVSQAGTTRATHRLVPRDLLGWLAFFLIVVGVRLLLVANYGSAMPILDQWDDEAARIFKPWLEGTLAASDVFAAHNEHRPVLARLLALGLLAANEQWDARVQMVANTVVAGLLAVMIAALGVRLVGRQHRTLVLTAVACWSALPYAWENTTWAFQSSFYFLLLFSVCAIWRLITCAALTNGWWLGAAAAVLTCMSMASGFLAAAAVLVVVALRWLTGRTTARASIPTVVVCVAMIAGGFALRTHVAGHDVYRAASAAQWLEAIARCLAWPFTRYSVACIVTYLPIVLLGLAYFRRKDADLKLANAARIETILGIGLWVALQSAAIAYARAGALVDGFVPPRYMDILALGGLANLFALLAVADPVGSMRRSSVQVAGATWVAIIFVGACLSSYDGWVHLRARADQIRAAEKHVRAYVATGDVAHLANDSAHAAYPAADHLAGRLDDATIRRVLPAAIARPLALEADGSSGPFLPQPREIGERIWSSEASASNAEAAGEIRTRVIRPSLPYLWVEMRGALGDGISLKVRDARSGDQHGVPFTPNPNGWRVGYAAVHGDVRIIARDENAERSLAFTEPREVGRLSYFAEQVLRRSIYVCFAGLAILSGLVAHSALKRSGSSAALVDP